MQSERPTTRLVYLDTILFFNTPLPYGYVHLNLHSSWPHCVGQNLRIKFRFDVVRFAFPSEKTFTRTKIASCSLQSCLSDMTDTQTTKKILTETTNSQAQLISLKRSDMKWDQIETHKSLKSYSSRFFVCQHIESFVLLRCQDKADWLFASSPFRLSEGITVRATPLDKKLPNFKSKEVKFRWDLEYRLEGSHGSSLTWCCFAWIEGLVAKCVLLSFNLRHCGSKSGSEIS